MFIGKYIENDCRSEGLLIPVIQEPHWVTWEDIPRL